MFEKRSYIDIIEMLGSDQHNGLSAAEARVRLLKNGPNAIEEKKAKKQIADIRFTAHGPNDLHPFCSRGYLFIPA